MSKGNIEQAETITSNPVYKQTSFWIAVIAVIGTLGNGYMLYKTNHTNQELDRINIIIAYQGDQIEKARAREEKHIKKILEQGMTIMRLTGELQDKTSQADLLNGFIESLPLSAWIKVKGQDGIFRIVTINEQFTVDYAMTKREMVGKSDYELFPLDLAEAYQAGDHKVYDSGESFRDELDMIVRGERIPSPYIKFPITLPSGFEGIGGMIIN